MALNKLSAAALLVAILHFPAAGSAATQQNIGLKDVTDTLERSYGSILTSVTADFFQQTTLTGRAPLRADGEMSLKTATSSTPLMFRFDYFRPTRQQVICNGRYLWVYLPEDRRVVERDVTALLNPFTFDAERDRAVNFLQGLSRISRDFQVLFASPQLDATGNYILELTPRRASATIARLFLVIDRQAVIRYVQNGRNAVYDPQQPQLAFPLRSSTVYDHQGNATTMEFSNVRTNSWLSDGLFVFTPPADVQVIRPRAGVTP